MFLRKIWPVGIYRGRRSCGDMTLRTSESSLPSLWEPQISTNTLLLVWHSRRKRCRLISRGCSTFDSLPERRLFWCFTHLTSFYQSSHVHFLPNPLSFIPNFSYIYSVIMTLSFNKPRPHDRGTGVRYLMGYTILFLLISHVKTNPESTRLPNQWIPEVKPEHSPLSTAKVKKAWIHFSVIMFSRHDA